MGIIPTAPNAISVSGEHSFCVNLFNTDYLTNRSEPDYDKLIRKSEHAKSLKPDIFVVLIHWSAEYTTKENSYQVELSDFLIAHGARTLFWASIPMWCSPWSTAELLWRI